MLNSDMLVYGVIEDAFPHTGCYVVRTSQDNSIQAMDASKFGLLPIGSRPLGGYSIRTPVLVAVLARGVAVIVGAVSAPASQANALLPDSLTSRGRSGFHEEEAHYSLYAGADHGLSNFSGGRPQDTCMGDWGSITELGLAVYLGRFIAALKASDAAKIEAFWGDDLLKITGYNLEEHTSCAEHKKLNDEGEYHEIYRSTPFSWEGMGFGKSEDVTKDNGQILLKKGVEDAPREPKEKDQLIIARHIVSRGYLGDIEREWVVIPEENLAPETYTKKSKHNGVFESIKHINGAYTLRSAKEITFEKYTIIAAPKELIQPDDPTGDDASSYAAAGQVGSGEKPEMEEFVWGSTENSGIRAAQLFEYHAYLHNRYMYMGFINHKKDWYVPEEADLTKLGDGSIYNKDLQIKHKFLAPLPTFEEVEVDKRTGHKVKYYASRSCIKQFDDGSILMQDGYGGHIYMHGGSIEFSCVGDIWLKPGRNLVAWAPHDAVVKAGNSVDITASKKDIRLKAENNLHMLGGNSGTGSILLESRSDGTNYAAGFGDNIGESVESKGIILKTKSSPIQALSPSGIALSIGEEGTGVLSLDAGKNGSVLLRGRDVLTKAKASIGMSVLSDAEGEDSGEEKVFAINTARAIMTAPLQLKGDLQVVPGAAGSGEGQGNVLVGGTLQTGGQVLAIGAVLSNVAVKAITDEDSKFKLPEDPETTGQRVKEQAAELESNIVEKEKELVEDADKAPGNPDYQESVGFSCRDTEKDLKLEEDFLLHETCWQRMLRKAGASTTWEEPEVKAPGVDGAGEITYPHPGKKGWEDMDAFAVVDGANFNDETGKAKNREDLKSQGEEATKTTLKSGYLINTQE